MPRPFSFPGCNSERMPAYQRLAVTTVTPSAVSFLRHAGQGLQQTLKVGHLLGFLCIRHDEFHAITVSRPVAHNPANPNRKSGEGRCKFDGNFPSDFQLDSGSHSHATFFEFVSAAIV